MAMITTLRLLVDRSKDGLAKAASAAEEKPDTRPVDAKGDDRSGSDERLDSTVERREAGASLVEFALILPLLLLLVFGIISFGLIFHAKLSITDGAREAGRYGATLPVTNFASSTDPMRAWLDEIAARAVTDATGSLDPGVASRVVCVAYVHPSGSAPTDVTTRRMETAGSATYSTASCFADGRPDDERRVQVQVARDSDLEAIFFSMTVPLQADSVTRYEASLVPS